jgi:phosphoglycerol transferase MdoB-like AlkP superfamily enzyme
MAVYWVATIVALSNAFHASACGPGDEPECKLGEELARYFASDATLFSLPILALAFFVLKRDNSSWKFAIVYFSVGLLMCVARLVWHGDDIGVLVPAIVYPVLLLGADVRLVLGGISFNLVCVVLLAIPSARRWYRPSRPATAA